MEPLEISDSNGMHDMSPEHMPPPSQRTPLNEEFAAGNECKPTWYGELEGGTCEAICVAVEDDDPTAGCNQVTACLCGLLLRAERVGNMPVLYARRRPGKPSQLICLVGPFWPCLMGVTYPLILGVSLFSAIFLLPDAPTWAVVLWAICTCTLVVALTLTACTNPGIVRRHRDEPPANTVSDIYASSDCILSLSLSLSLLLSCLCISCLSNLLVCFMGICHLLLRFDETEQSGWRWSDQAQTYRPPRSSYDRDCGVVIEEFDHTCPWTGTGIGKANMPYFSTFVSCVCICLIFNILLMVGIFAPDVGNGDNS